jgi:hypothetical protein
MSQSSKKLETLINSLKKNNADIIKNSKILYEASKEIEVIVRVSDSKAKKYIAKMLDSKKPLKKVPKDYEIINSILKERLIPAREGLEKTIEQKKKISKDIISFQLHHPDELEQIQKNITTGLGDGSLERAEQILQYHKQMRDLLKQISELKKSIVDIDQRGAISKKLKLKYYELMQEYDKMDKKVSDQLAGKKRESYVQPLPLKRKSYVQPLPLIEYSKTDILLSDFCDMLSEKNVLTDEKEYILTQMVGLFRQPQKINDRTKYRVSDTLAVSSRLNSDIKVRREASKTFAIFSRI